ncbi:matrixin family metalloprotease [Acinetobacter sp.]|uniref:matrixin family metalloprotease n=1 Tax=Acinetobacter sp. TaxID=472 RepID=UPI003B00BD18
MRFWILLCVIAFTAYFAIQRMMYPQLNHNSAIDRITHPLDTRLRYRIGEVDPRFHVSKQQVQNLAQQATDIWHLGTMKSLFVYDDHAKLTINLIYDERQAESSARNQELRILQNTQQYTQSEKQKIQQLHAELDRTNDKLDLQKTNYQRKVDQYNQLVNTLNQSHQNLDASARFQLDQQKNQLIIEQNQLKQQLDIYNQKVYELNHQVEQLNTVNQQYNQSVDHFNSRFQPRQFDKGVFDGKTINIYEFASDEDLRVTIAHELGHALGLAHNNDPKALMYPMMKEQDLKNFRLTTADLAMLNSRQR